VNLDSKYYLHEMGEYRCEEHYFQTFAPDFHEHVDWRKRKFLSKGPFESIYPDGKLPYRMEGNEIVMAG